MTKPTGKCVSVSVSDASETKRSYRYQCMAMTMEDGSVWVRSRSNADDWSWSEWVLVYAPE